MLIYHKEFSKNFKQEVLDSWAAYQDSKQHLTNNEVRNWLEIWGTDKETKMPNCHK